MRLDVLALSAILVRSGAKRKIMDGRPVMAYSHWMLKVVTIGPIRRNTRVRVSCLLSSLAVYKIRLLSWEAMHSPLENLVGDDKEWKRIFSWMTLFCVYTREVVEDFLVRAVILHINDSNEVPSRDIQAIWR